MLVMKFGGTSLGDRERIDTVVVAGAGPPRPQTRRRLLGARRGDGPPPQGAGARPRGASRTSAVEKREHGLLATLGLPDVPRADDDLERQAQISRGCRSWAN